MCHCTTSWLYVTFMLLSIALHSLTAVENSHFLQSPLYKRGCVVRTPAGGPHLLQQRLFFVYPRVGGGTHEEGRGGHQRANQMSAPFGGGYKSCVRSSPAAFSELAASRLLLLLPHSSVRYICLLLRHLGSDTGFTSTGSSEGFVRERSNNLFFLGRKLTNEENASHPQHDDHRGVSCT